MSEKIISVTRQITVLYTIVIACAVNVFLIYKSQTRYEDILVESFICLIVSMFVFHLLFITRRKIFDKNVTKYIDYVYLTIAAVGLLGAADFTAKNYNKELIENLEYTHAGLIGGQDSIQDMLEKYCHPPLDSKRCDIMRALEAPLKELIGRVEVAITNGPISHPSRFVRDINLKLEELSNIELNLIYNGGINIIPVYFIHYKYIMERYEKVPFGYGDKADYYFYFEKMIDFSWLKGLGYLLIAAALGLRITRVTVEIWELWSKTPDTLPSLVNKKS